MSAPLQIRPATEADLEVLLTLFESAGLDRPGENDRAQAPVLWQRLRQAGAQVLLAERDGQPLGTLTLYVLPLLAHQGRPGAVVEDVAVLPSEQGQGVGRALMTAAMQQALRAGCYKLALSSNASRQAAHAFYDHLGFDRHGISFAVTLPQEKV